MLRLLLAKLLLAAMQPHPTLVIAAPDGHLAVLDEAGAVIAEAPGAFVDVAADPGDRAAFWALAPGGDEPGELVRFRVVDGALVREASRPFEAPSGALLTGGADPVVLSIAEGASLDRGGYGVGVGLVASGGGAGRLVWTFSPWPEPTYARFIVAAAGVSRLDERALDAAADPDRARAVSVRGAPRLVVADDATVRLSGSTSAAPTGGWVLDARSGPSGTVFALVGDAPRLVAFRPTGSPTVTALPGGALPHSASVVHRLAGGADGAAWVALGERLARVAGGAVTEHPVPAIAIAALGRDLDE